MPNYDYHCPTCLHKTEVFQKITDKPLITCPSCQQTGFQRGPGGGIGLQFKGSGFYITDYDPARKTADSNAQNSTANSACCPCGKKAC